MKDLILDLQDNGGGLLKAAFEMGDEFISGDKLLVYTEGRAFPREDYKARRGISGSFEKGRMSVLIDESSASASEIVSGAIQDWDRGLIVGRRSFGKGLVQKPVTLNDSSELRITISRYYTPSGRSIQKKYEHGDSKSYQAEMENRYKLDSADEAQRLEDQSSQDNYSIKDELQIAGVTIQPNDLILDAGCGTGVLSRALIDLFPGTTFKIDAFDMTDRLLEYAKEEIRKNHHYQNRINFQKKDICELTSKNIYHKIFSRFVFQHIPNREAQLKAAKSLYHSLAPGGSLYLIDCYGFLSHLDTNNSWLQEQIKRVEECIPIDMNIGIKLRGLFLDIGIPVGQVKTQIENFRFEWQNCFKEVVRRNQRTLLRESRQDYWTTR
jgi:2-polyprenyl-3-methyl-5-hydroxy-6-metoxy-1,4-benzoquinol methylase